jgi:ATP-dependent DNA ligase
VEINSVRCDCRVFLPESSAFCRNCEGIVSKRLGSPYRAGRSDHWLKIKNPSAPAVRRLEEEDWQ